MLPAGMAWIGASPLSLQYAQMLKSERPKEEMKGSPSPHREPVSSMEMAAPPMMGANGEETSPLRPSQGLPRQRAASRVLIRRLSDLMLRALDRASDVWDPLLTAPDPSTSYVMDPLAISNRAEPVDRYGRALPWRWGRSLTRDLLGRYGPIVGSVALLISVLGHGFLVSPPRGDMPVVLPRASGISPQPKVPPAEVVPPSLPSQPQPQSGGVQQQTATTSPNSLAQAPSAFLMLLAGFVVGAAAVWIAGRRLRRELRRRRRRVYALERELAATQSLLATQSTKGKSELSARG